MKVRNVTRGELYDFYDADYDRTIDAWFRVGKDWRRLCTLSHVWAMMAGLPVRSTLR